ncbi:esterase SG1-like [Contarinia nasturtii]|uniref:esterase SG1-like n=1 Tax=Contarinia nasturtii TaxID=265458 RepID=UPI0012D4C338|nr:esterase SG1-like [Contarinia nasturtii]
MLRFVTFLLCVTWLATVNGQDSHKVVETNSGNVKGQLEKTLWLETPFYSFRGIPYAKAPIGKLRFKAPEPIKKWKGVRNAFKYGNKCAQRFAIFNEKSEDCLFLNVFVPAIKNEKEKLPVSLVLHAGLFAGGSGDEILPDFTVESDIILVTVNYRLGILGFLSLGTPKYSGNMALKDQQLAMKWIHENIEAFGGDNKRITIIGVSAGGKANGFHLLNEESSKYFNQQITMSATSNNIYSLNNGDHRCMMEIFYAKHNSGKSNLTKLIDFLEKANVDDILNFNQNAISGLISPWTPIIEKTNAKRSFFTEDPMTKFQTTKSINKVAFFTSTQYVSLKYW